MNRIGSITTTALGIGVGIVWVLRGVAWYIEHQVKPGGAPR